MIESGTSLRALALEALAVVDPVAKASRVRDIHTARDRLCLDPDAVLVPGQPLPGRPPRPRLVPAQAVPSRSPFTVPGRAALLHAVTHIEFNAIKIV